MFEDEEDCAPISTADAVREWVWVAGAERPDTQWLLSDYDTWERNPHYAGPDQRHPEDYQEELTEEDMIARCDQAMDAYWAAEAEATRADYEAALIERELTASPHPQGDY